MNGKGPNGFKTNTAVAAITEPGNYTLTVQNNNIDPPCFASAEVTIQGYITMPGIELQEQPSIICTGTTFDLSSLEIKDTNNTIPIYSYHSGTPATTNNEVDTSLVQIMGDTTFYVMATNSGDCTDEIPVSFSTIQSPSAEFTVSSPICLVETATVKLYWWSKR